MDVVMGIPPRLDMEITEGKIVDIFHFVEYAFIHHDDITEIIVLLWSPVVEIKETELKAAASRILDPDPQIIISPQIEEFRPGKKYPYSDERERVVIFLKPVLKADSFSVVFKPEDIRIALGGKIAWALLCIRRCSGG